MLADRGDHSSVSDNGERESDSLATPSRQQEEAGEVAPQEHSLDAPTQASSHPLDAVVDGLANRSPASYERLYDLMADRLYRLAFRLLSDRQEAEDAVQQAFLELTRTNDPPTRGPSLEAWLYASVRFTCLDTQRTRSRRPAVPHEQVPEIDGEDEYDLGLDPQLESALALLTPDQRLVIHLKHVEGLNGYQIAEIVGSNRIAVYAMAGRAERRMQRWIQLDQKNRRGSNGGGAGHGQAR